MPPPTRVDSYNYREFNVVVARSGDKFWAVGRDSDSKQVADASGFSLDEVNADIKQMLAKISLDYMGIDGAINLFLKAFPNGFSSSTQINDERSAKDRTAALVADKLSEERIALFHRDGNHAAVCAAAKETLGTSQLAFPNERMALADALKEPNAIRSFSENLFELLYGDFSKGLERMVHLLKPFSAAKWPILTFWPFFRFPGHHTFVKPTVFQTCAHKMGYEFHYEVMPNPKTYLSCLEFTEFLKTRLISIGPKDNIDIQTFMYVVGSENYRKHLANSSST